MTITVLYALALLIVNVVFTLAGNTLYFVKSLLSLFYLLELIGKSSFLIIIPIILAVRR